MTWTCAVATRCEQFVCAPACVKAEHVARGERGKRMCDNLDRKDVSAIALLALTAKDIANLEALAEAGRTKNYAAIIRRLVARAAKENE